MIVPVPVMSHTLKSLIETIPGVFSGKHLQENLYLRVKLHLCCLCSCRFSLEEIHSKTTKQIMTKSQPEHRQTKESPTVSTEDHLRFQGLDAQAGPFSDGMGWLQ